jgi:hypothetical protein
MQYAAAFGQRNEAGRRNTTMLRGIPACQHFEAGNVSADQIQLGLEGWPEFTSRRPCRKAASDNVSVTLSPRFLTVVRTTERGHHQVILW